MPKHVYCIALLILGCLWHGAVFGAQDKLANVTIAYTSISPQYAPVWIAKEAGFFKKNGVNAQLVYMRGGVVATQALVSNDVNFINAGGGGVVDAVLGGADIVIVACPINQEPQVLVTKREIKEIAQLKGKKARRQQSRGPGYVVSLKMILAALGLDPDRDVSYLAVGPSSSRFGALQLGQVDATTLAPPFTFAARKAGYNFFEDLPGMKGIGIAQCGAGHEPEDFTRREPFATEMVIKSVIEGIHFYKTEKSKTPGDPEKVHEIGKQRGASRDLSVLREAARGKALSHREGHSDYSRLVETAGCAKGQSSAIHSDEGRLRNWISRDLSTVCIRNSERNV